MKQTSILIATMLASATMPTLGTTVYSVPANANLFSAGLSSPVAPAGGGAGVLPNLVSITPGTISFQFAASGTYTFDGGTHVVGPDGNSGSFSPMNINSYGGISGWYGPGSPLCGVFLTSATPQAPAPPRLDFTGNNEHPNFLTLSPVLGQMFFIGDGVADGTSTTQTFFVPQGATRLFLGLPDCVNAQGDPGAYGDNSGTISVSVTAIPEPAAMALAGIGMALLITARVRRSSVWAFSEVRVS